MLPVAQSVYYLASNLKSGPDNLCPYTIHNTIIEIYYNDILRQKHIHVWLASCTHNTKMYYF